MMLSTYGARAGTTFVALLFVAVASLYLASLAIGQITFGSITGVVTDPSGAAVPNTAVTLANQHTGFKRGSNDGRVLNLSLRLQF